MSINEIEQPEITATRALRMKWARRRIRPRLSQKELAKRVGVSLKSIQLMERENGTQRSKFLDRVAIELKVSLPWLMDGKGEPDTLSLENDFHRIPTVTSDGAVDSNETGILTFSWLSESIRKPIQFQISDESMSPVMPVGTRVVVDPEKVPGPGEYVLVQHKNGEPALRTWRDRGVYVELAPENSDFAVTESLKNDVRVLGCVVGYWMVLE